MNFKCLWNSMTQWVGWMDYIWKTRMINSFFRVFFCIFLLYFRSSNGWSTDKLHQQSNFYESTASKIHKRQEINDRQMKLSCNRSLWGCLWIPVISCYLLVSIIQVCNGIFVTKEGKITKGKQGRLKEWLEQNNRTFLLLLDMKEVINWQCIRSTVFISSWMPCRLILLCFLCKHMNEEITTDDKVNKGRGLLSSKKRSNKKISFSQRR